MSNYPWVSRVSARWLALFVLLAGALFFSACTDAEMIFDDGSPAAETQPADEDDGDWYYTETPEDCLADEEFDEEDELCYPIIECDEEGICADDYGFVDLFFDLVGELVLGVAGEDFEDAAALEENTLITYRVDGNQIVEPELAPVTDDLLDFQADTETHQRVWVYFARLIPAEQRALVTKYVVFTDGPEEVLAFVTQDTDDPTRWLLGVDIADSGNPEELTFTLLHEFAHLLTLNNEQVPVNEELVLQPDDETLYEEAASACPVYFPGEGCSEPTSYINEFYERFWADIYDEWLDINLIEDEEEYAAAAEAFYLAREGDFVSDYAATSPEEDIAESFATFVLTPKPKGRSLADKKVAFFYDYPELVALRAEMSGRILSRLRRR